MSELNIKLTKEAPINVPDTGLFTLLNVDQTSTDNHSDNIVGISFIIIIIIFATIVAFNKRRNHYYYNLRNNNQFRRNSFLIQTKPKTLIGFAIASILLFITVPLIKSHSPTNDKYVLAKETDMLTLDTFPINITTKLSVKDAITATPNDIVVKSATPAGYTLKVYSSTADLKATDETIETKIASLTNPAGSAVNNAALSSNTWGIAFTLPTDTSSEIWHTMPDTELTAITIKQSTNPTPANDKTTVYYGINVNDDLEAGEYANTINYIAIANIVPEPDTYTLKYDANGNNTSGIMANQTITMGKSFTLSINKFTREGFTFTGWNTRSDGKGNSYTDGQTITTDLTTTANSTITLYAQWKEIPPDTYIIKYDANSNDANGTMADQTVTMGESFTLSTNQYTREGFAFTGWNTKSNGEGNTYTDGQTITTDLTTTANSTITLYAQWKSLKLYMQDVTYSECQALASSENVTAYDRRDEQAYTIRIVNDSCWMTTNLNLAGGTTVTPELSNVTSSYTLPASSTEGFNTDNANVAHVYNGDSTNCGASTPCYGYYSWAAATAGSTASSGNAETDICPKNWRLPNSGELSSLLSTYPTGADLTVAPFNAVYSGAFEAPFAEHTEFTHGGTAGSIWSSNTDSSALADYFYYASNESSFVMHNTKGYGISIRCILK